MQSAHICYPNVIAPSHSLQNVRPLKQKREYTCFLSKGKFKVTHFNKVHFQFIPFDLTSLPAGLALLSLSRVASFTLEPLLDAPAARLEISLHQLFRFSLSGRTGSGFHMTWAGTGSLFRNSSFFIITQTGLLIASGLGDLLVKGGGHMLQGLLIFAVRLPSDQLKPEGYSGPLLYNKASSVANLDSSGCRNGYR